VRNAVSSSCQYLLCTPWGAGLLRLSYCSLKSPVGNSALSHPHFAVTRFPDNLKAVLRLDNAKKRMLYLGVC